MSDLDQYAAWLRHRYSSLATQKSYLMTATMYVKFQAGKPSLASAQAWLYLMLDKGCGASSVQQRKHGLATYFRYLEELEEIPDGTAYKVTKIRTPKVIKKIPTVLPKDHYEAMLAVAVDLCDVAMLKLAWDCALRCQELLSVRYEDLTAKPGYLAVHTAKLRDGSYEYNYTPVQHDTIMAAIRYARRRGIKAGALFKPYTDEKVSSMLARLGKRAGVKPADKDSYNPHSIRHGSALDKLRASNYNIRYVQGILRHKSIESTMIYLHLDPEDLKKISEQSRPTTTPTPEDLEDE